MHNINELIKSPKGRLEIVKAITTKKYYDRDGSSHKGDDWQANSTPMSIANKMVDKVDEVKNKSIFIMFNLEFLEALIYIKGVGRENITFLADNEVKQQMAENVYGVKTLLITKENHNVKGMKEIMANKKFDVIFSNPPYNASIDIKILKEVTPLAKELVIVHPSTWLIDRKMKKSLFNAYREQINGNIRSVEMFNGNTIFNIGLFVPTVITHIDNNFNGDCDVKYFNDEYTVNTVFDITKYSSSWNTIVEPFKNSITQWIETNSSVWSNITDAKNIDDTKYYCQLANIRGTGYRGKNDSESLFMNDFYTLVQQDIEKNKGIRSDTILPTFVFDNKDEQDNFLSYCQTNFARFCVSIFKDNANLHRGALDILPYLDFTQEWNDEKLYEFFNINKETQEYITNFLPDFHGIRGDK